MRKFKLSYNEAGEFVIQRSLWGKIESLFGFYMLMIIAICFISAAWGQTFEMVVAILFTAISIFIYRKDISTFPDNDDLYFSPHSKKIYRNFQDILSFDDVEFIEHITKTYDEGSDTRVLNLRLKQMKHKELMIIDEDGYVYETKNAAEELARMMGKRIVYKKE